MHIVTVIGARPQFIKAAVLSRYLKDHPSLGIRETLVHTGQHYDANMSDIFFTQMDIPYPDVNLHLGSGSHGAMTGTMLTEIEKILLDEKPDAVLVYGDTNSTLAGALAASKLLIPVIHVEAGLRSYMMAMPEVADMQKQISALDAEYQKEMKAMSDEYNKKYSDFIAQQDSLTENIRLRRMQELEDIQQRTQNLIQVAQQDIQKKQTDLLAPIQEKLRNAIQAVGKENGYLYILDPQIVLYKSDTAIDATAQVKAKLGIQ